MSGLSFLLVEQTEFVDGVDMRERGRVKFLV